MSKSIYKEAIEMLLSMGTEPISVPSNPIGEENSHMIHLRDATENYETNMYEVIEALEEAQKQEKLLELYKELVNLHNQYLNEKNKMKKLEIIRKTSNVEEEIKELENGMEKV